MERDFEESFRDVGGALSKAASEDFEALLFIRSTFESFKQFARKQRSEAGF
jgi:hypothetical protein